MTPLQKTLKYLAMAFAIFLCISILIGIFGGLYTVSYFISVNSGEKVVESIMTEQFSGGEITGLRVNISAAELEIKAGEKFSVETNHKYITCKENGDILEIDETKPFFASHPGGMKVILTVPKETVFDYADIRTAAGSLKIDNFRVNSFSANLGAGELSANGLYVLHNTEIEGGAGSVTIQHSYLNNADIDMGVGELDFEGELDGNCSIDYGIGETNLVLSGTDNDYTIELDKGIGEAMIEGKKMSDDSVYGYGIRQIEIDGGIGELNITFNPKNEYEKM